MKALPTIVVLDDLVSEPIAEMLKVGAGDHNVEIAQFQTDDDAYRFVAENANRIVAYIQDIDRYDKKAATNIKRGLCFFHEVIDQFTPRAKVVFHSATLDYWGTNSLLPKEATDRFRFYWKPQGLETFRSLFPWLLQPAPQQRSKNVSNSLSLVIPPWSQICKYLANNPEFLHRIDPRKFEELIGEIFKSNGWIVDFTSVTRDGGYDIIAIRRAFPTSLQALVEVKRWNPEKPVGVQVVRALYGVRSKNPTSQLVLATSSYISPDAKREFARVVPWEIDFMERDIILEWCRTYDAVVLGGTLRKDQQSEREISRKVVPPDHR
jgi:hypothetical protein